MFMLVVRVKFGAGGGGEQGENSDRLDGAEEVSGKGEEKEEK